LIGRAEHVARWQHEADGIGPREQAGEGIVAGIARCVVGGCCNRDDVLVFVQQLHGYVVEAQFVGVLNAICVGVQPDSIAEFSQVEEDHHIVAGGIVIAARLVADGGGQSGTEEVGQQRAFVQRLKCSRFRVSPSKSTGNGVFPVVLDNDISVGQLRLVLVERTDVQDRVVQGDRADDIVLIVIRIAIADTGFGHRVATDLDGECRAGVHGKVAHLVQDAGAGSGRNHRASTCDQVAPDRAGAQQRLSIGQDERTGQRGAVQFGHIECGAAAEVDHNGFRHDIVRGVVDQRQPAVGDDQGARERVVGGQAQRSRPLLEQAAVVRGAWRGVMQQRAQDGSVKAAGVDDRAAGENHPLRNQSRVRAGQDVVKQIRHARRFGFEQAAVETDDERVVPCLGDGRRPVPVQVHAVGKQRAVCRQVNRQAVVPRIGRIARGPVNDFVHGQNSTGQIDNGLAFFQVLQAVCVHGPATDVDRRTAAVLASDDRSLDIKLRAGTADVHDGTAATDAGDEVLSDADGCRVADMDDGRSTVEAHDEVAGYDDLRGPTANIAGGVYSASRHQIESHLEHAAGHVKPSRVADLIARQQGALGSYRPAGDAECRSLDEHARRTVGAARTIRVDGGAREV